MNGGITTPRLKEILRRFFQAADDAMLARKLRRATPRWTKFSVRGRLNGYSCGGPPHESIRADAAGETKVSFNGRAFAVRKWPW